MSGEMHGFLETMFGNWHEVAGETIRCLGEDAAGAFIHLHGDWRAIVGAVSDAHSLADRLGSLVFADFHGLHKELTHFQTDFLSGKYPHVNRNLRFVWELVFRAYHADTYALCHSNDRESPGPTIDEKNAWLGARERDLNWNAVIVPTLESLFPAISRADLTARFRPLWDRLNRSVHPSADYRDRIVGPSALQACDSFDEDWARETLVDAADVFGLIWLAVVDRFPAPLPTLLADPKTFHACPQVRSVLENSAARYV